ncbi:MAG TPA: MbtH family protein [Streptosporangiaceae bacterium]|jgi:MbtH protein
MTDTIQVGDYRTARNDEEQPADQALPPGWNDEGAIGPRPGSLGHVKRTWMDMRPASMHRGRC